MTTHWRKLINPKYLGAYSLEEGEERVVEIIEVKGEVIKGEGGKEDNKPVAYLKDEKPMIINATNAKTLTRLFGTPRIEYWKGRKVTVRAEVIKDKRSGEEVEGLRIKPELPPLPELTPSHSQWNEAAKAVKAGKIDKVLARYSVSGDNIKLLNA